MAGRGPRAKRRHDEIQRDLEYKLQQYSKHYLGGIEWDEQNIHNHPWASEDIIATEWQYDGEVPSGKSYCRVDIMLSVGDTTWALEIKTSESDVKNWPGQRDDYAAIGMTPVLVVPSRLVWECAPGHRLITETPHIAVDGHDYHWVGDNPPVKFDKQFEIGAPYELPPECCPDCGYKMRYSADLDGTGMANCMACGTVI